MRNPLSKVITEIEPSGIRKFFDIVSEMRMQFLLVLVSRILTHHGIFVMRVSIRWKKVELSIHQMQV